MKRNLEKSELLRLFYKTSNIPLILFSGTDIIQKESHPLQDFSLPLILFDGVARPLPCAFYGFTPEYLYFGGICIPETNEVIFLGPILRSQCSVRQSRQICERLGRPASSASKVQDYLNITGGRTLDSILSGIRSLCYLLDLPHPEEIRSVPFRWNLPYPIRALPHAEPLNEEDRDLERQILTNIHSGNIDVLNEIISQYFSGTSYQPVNIVPVHRTYILGANVRFAHETITAGADKDTVYLLSNQYIDQILQAKTSTDLSDLFFRLITEYARLVADLRNLPSASPVVRYIHQYIHTHPDEKITPHQLAGKLNMNCSYLCTFFRKETGMTISRYVQEEKIKTAKHLLSGSDLSLVEISEALAFSSQSYFGKIFKKITGMTPESYRSQQ